MKKSRICTCLLVAMVCVMWAAWNVPAIADDADSAQQQSAADSNYAQNQHAINVAEAATLKDPEVASLKEYLGYTEDALQRALKSKDEDKIEDARAAYESAREQYDTAFAEAYEGKRAEIDALRADELGWGVIARKMGVHPRVLGLGHTKHQNSFERNYQASKQKGMHEQKSDDSFVDAHRGKHAGYGHGKDRGGKSGSRGGGNGGGHGGGKK